MLRKFSTSFLVLIFLVGFSSPDHAFAAKSKKKKGNKAKTVSAQDVFSVTSNVKSCKTNKKGRKKCKTKEREFECVGSLGGVTKATSTEGMLKFKSYKSMASSKPAGSAKHKKFMALHKASRKSCKNPPALSLTPYKGTFGEREARILYERFAFGAPDSEIQRAVSDGLDATVNRLLTYTVDTDMDNKMADIRCDEYLAGHELDDPNACDARNPSDFSTSGLKLSWLLEMAEGINPFHSRLGFWIHNNFMAVDTRVLSSSSRYMALDTLNLIRDAARTGDFIAYQKALTLDPFTHLKWLSGDGATRTDPVEDFGREAMELGLLGDKNCEGEDNYTDKDVVMAALANTGWYLDYEVLFTYVDEKGKEREAKKAYPVFDKDEHPLFPHPIFEGTPYESTIDDGPTLIDALVRHPESSRYVAKRIWERFINDKYTCKALDELAEIVRRHNFNLIEIFREVMKTRVIYAEESQNTLYKDGLELIIGAIRNLDGFRVGTSNSRHRGLGEIIARLGYVPLTAPTVFGYNDKPPSEYESLEYLNALEDLFDLWEERRTERGYDMHGKLVAGVTTSGDFVRKIGRLMNVEWSAEQVSQIEQLLNYRYKTCESPSDHPDCEAGAEKYLKRAVFDPHPDAMEEGQADKMEEVLFQAAASMDYRLK